MIAIANLIALVAGVAFVAVLLAAAVGLAAALVALIGVGISLALSRRWLPIVYNLRSLGVRRWTTALTALGLAFVVSVFATVLMLGAGIRATLRATGSDDNAKIIRAGSQAELQSVLLPEQVRLLSSAPELAVGSDGKPLLSSELVVLIFAPRDGAVGDQDGSNINVRGVSPSALELHRPRAIEGRMFRPGTSEIVIGRGLVGRFQGMRLGQSVAFAQRRWTVVGVMDQGGTASDSEVWGDVDQIMDAFARRPTLSSVTVRLKDRTQLAALQARLAADPTLSSLEAVRETDYWSAQSEQFSGFVKSLGLFVAIIFSLGAVLGAMITMYAQVAARTREIGTLRALGFRRRAILFSFVSESVLLALGAGLVGVALAAPLQWFSFSTTNFQTFSEVSFRFHLSLPILVGALAFAGAMGFAGGLLPAVRAARLPIVRATRA